MTTIKFLCIFLLMTTFSCKQKEEKHKTNPAAIALHKQATTFSLLQNLNNPDSAQKAIQLLDSSTTIDKDYFQAYYSKLMFLYPLKKYEKIKQTIDQLIRLRPFAHDIYMIAGILYEIMNDTITSKNYFERSLAISNSVLDTMNTKNRDYEMLLKNKAFCLVMLENQLEAKNVYRLLSEMQTDSNSRAWTLSKMNKTKKDLLKEMLNEEDTTTKSAISNSELIKK